MDVKSFSINFGKPFNQACQTGGPLAAYGPKKKKMISKMVENLAILRNYVIGVPKPTF